MSWNKNSGYGMSLMNNIASQVPAFGNILVVVNSSDSTNHLQHLQDLFPNDSDGRVRYFTSLSDAYTAAVSNNNDVIVLD
jgi:hypothetical protein